MSILQMFRVTIRATQEAVPQALAKQMEQKLAQGAPDEMFGSR
jgi:AP-2 complex subunit alpha